MKVWGIMMYLRNRLFIRWRLTEWETEQEITDIFLAILAEFDTYWENKLISKQDMDVSISLENNPCRKLTQILARYSKNKENTKWIYYLDTNNLYGYIICRMMPLQLHISMTLKEKDCEQWSYSLDTTFWYIRLAWLFYWMWY